MCFEVLVQPSRHVPVAVVERVGLARAVLKPVLEPVLKPVLLRKFVPAEALLQRVDLSLQPERLVLGEDLNV